jgi:hypothetical protein
MLTYTSDDGQDSVTVWNGRDGVVPDVIDLPSGGQGQLTAAVWQGPGFTPPDGTPAFGGTPPEPDPAPGASQVDLGYPGQPYLTGGS